MGTGRIGLLEEDEEDEDDDTKRSVECRCSTVLFTAKCTINMMRTNRIPFLMELDTTSAVDIVMYLFF